MVLTTYESLRMHREMLLPVRWGVAVLDEVRGVLFCAGKGCIC